MMGIPITFPGYLLDLPRESVGLSKFKFFPRSEPQGGTALLFLDIYRADENELSW